MDVVTAAWDFSICGNDMYMMMQKLRSVKYVLSLWRRSRFSGLSSQLSYARIHMSTAQAEVNLDIGATAEAREEKASVKDYMRIC